MSTIDQIPEKIIALYKIVSELEASFPGRRFTPDGHLVGSIGEVLAKHDFDLELLPASTETHDAKSSSGALVQIKATQGTSVGMRSEPEHLLVLELSSEDGTHTTIYNGPGALAWQNAGKMQSNGQRFISVKKLAELMKQVPTEQRLRSRSA